MRLDRFLGTVTPLSRREAAAAVRAGRVTVNGAAMRRPDGHIREGEDTVALDGAPLVYTRYCYVWLNKPAGYVSATEDGRGLPCVTDLLPPDDQKRGMFPCGRLDRDTTGWMLLTDDGPLSHRLLSPRHHVEKVYRFRCDAPLPPDAAARCAAGISLYGEDAPCKPALLLPDPDGYGGRITLTEGKYHQIKRMTEALGARVTELERISFAGIPLDPALPRGATRPASEDEIRRLRGATE